MSGPSREWIKNDTCPKGWTQRKGRRARNMERPEAMLGSFAFGVGCWLGDGKEAEAAVGYGEVA